MGQNITFFTIVKKHGIEFKNIIISNNYLVLGNQGCQMIFQDSQFCNVTMLFVELKNDEQSKMNSLAEYLSKSLEETIHSPEKMSFNFPFLLAVSCCSLYTDATHQKAAQ